MLAPLAFVAVRTDGPDPSEDDLLEIAVSRTEPFEAQPTDVFVARVRSTRAGQAEDSGGALWLTDAMNRVREMTRGCTLVAWDAANVRGYLQSLTFVWELIDLELAPGTLDLRALAWPIALAEGDGSLTAVGACTKLGIAHDPEAGAFDEVRALTELYRHLVRMYEPGARLASFTPDERAIVETITNRVENGRRAYGPWRVREDKRNYPHEALAEVLDCMNYCAAQLVRLSKEVR